MANTLKFGAGQWATKEGSTLAYNDENDNFKPLPFDFTRASSGTVVNKAGLIETVGNGIPRIDYKDDSKGALLLEPASTNLFEYSEDFSVSYWLKLGVGSASAPIVTADYATSPDGTQNATRVQFDAVGTSNADRSGLVRTFAFTTGQTYSISCWVKSTNGTSQVIQFRIAGSQTSEEQTATSEWKLYTATFTATASTTDQFGMQIRGINSVNESDILIYGMQLELLDYPTSYIPTQGSAVTRLADVCTNSGNDQVINSTEGVLYAEIKALSEIGGNRYISLSDGTDSNRIILRFQDTDKVGCYVRSASGSDADITKTSASISLNFLKVAVKWKTNDVALWVNGVEVGVDSSFTTFNANVLNRLNLTGATTTTSQYFYGNVKDLKVYNTALTDQELAALTS